MKRCFKFGIGRYEEIRGKFPKITSCKGEPGGLGLYESLHLVMVKPC
jgi:hypothetical protein